SQGLSGSLAGTVDGEGELSDPGSFEAKAKLDKIRIARGDFAGQNQAPVELSYSEGRLEIAPFTFAGPNTELSLGGSVGPKTIDVKMTGSMDMRLLESFVPRLERTAGRITVDAAASGLLKEPTLVGGAEVHDARISVRDQPISAHGLSGRVDFSE